ncbi:MAG: DUF58 domain-containing protein [Spirochaetales bacterium]|nr:DUF58 domain-containing protein [Spirochaetales bacterium]
MEKKDFITGLSKIIPYTLKGVFFFIFSGGMFCAGIIRADLAALFWGCGFLLVTLYALFGNHLCMVLFNNYFKSHTQSINLCFSDNGMFPGTSGSAHPDITLPPFFIPGFTVKLNLVLTWHNREPISLVIFLSPGKNNVELPFIPQHRGKYSCTALQFAIEDLFGFTHAVYSTGIEEYISVFPRLLDLDTLMLRVTGDESTDIQKKRRSNDELLEVKKYYPGDDIRRMNWKIYAHSKELFIRKGEETPPPDSRFLFILDPTVSPYISSHFNLDFLDSLIEVIASLMMMVLDNGNILYLSLPGRHEVLTYSQKQKNKLLALLSSVWWTEEQTNIKLPVKDNMHALVFAAPGSLSLPHIIRTLIAREWHLSLFLKNFTFPVPAKKKVTLKQLFFLSEEKRQKDVRIHPDMIIFKQGLFAEVERYKMAPWRIGDVREI